ncbi:hypothetical protein CAP40_17895 [Sphingomonas sp. IBVSS2]|uniref:hypothetical protein n=1 Tax=Sphingomonas sp. IBVSS2 TaxID=1985172 RepID=UPI000A2EA12D|nr:hypothetical protein [Sphingomonas sp. IBVSS2]OSZ63599.1 hypothetical protein CAP40_17895 [Sphingomonas sp. IBVSS2]
MSHAEFDDITATYDALNRLVTWSEAGNGVAPAASVSWRYDANGNIRVQSNAYRLLGGDGAVSTVDGPQSTTFWYRYDSMNRVVTDRGMLSGGRIVRGAGGVDLSYDAAGQRRTALSDKALSGYVNVWVWYPDFDPALGHELTVEQPGYNGDYQLQERGYYGQSLETYSYDGLGNLGSVQITASGYQDNGAGSLIETGVIDRDMGGGVYLYDLLGRQTRQIDSVEGGTVLYDHGQAWDAKGRVWQDNVYQKQGNDLVTTSTTNYYSDDAGSGYALGALTSSVSTGYRYVNGYSY